MQRGVLVKAILRNAKGEILLMRRSGTAPRRPLEWDLPGGYLDDDDASFQTACLREVQEEAGLAVVDDALHLVFAESDVSTSGEKELAVTWLYFEGVAASDNVELSYEHDDFIWATPERALQLIKYDRQLRAIRYIVEAGPRT